MNREQAKANENKQIALFLQLMEKQRLTFEYADASQYLIDEKCDVDLMFIMDKVTEWSKGAKNEAQSKALNEMFGSIVRVMQYIEVTRTVCKASVSKYVTTEKRMINLASELTLLRNEKDIEIRNLKTQLDHAKKEIEFVNNK